MIKIHANKPQRTCNKRFPRYQSFKSPLREDFRHRCGYCDDHDFYMGGSRGYHIDHFKPKSRFPKLETVYQNLVYSCPFCNISKSDTWEEPGFLDPCSDEYDNHLHRNSSGEILYKSTRGQFIHGNLKLYLKRHKVIWLIEKLRSQKRIISQLLETTEGMHAEEELKILREYYQLQKAIDDQVSFFRKD